MKLLYKMKPKIVLIAWVIAATVLNSVDGIRVFQTSDYYPVVDVFFFFYFSFFRSLSPKKKKNNIKNYWKQLNKKIYSLNAKSDSTEKKTSRGLRLKFSGERKIIINLYETRWLIFKSNIINLLAKKKKMQYIFLLFFNDSAP